MANIVLTGSSSGLGLEITKALRRADHYIVGVDKRPMGSGGLVNQQIHCDLEDPSEIQSACNQIWKNHSIDQIDILINCAGISEISMLQDLELTDWDRVMAINTNAIFLMVQNLFTLLVKSKGTILNIISDAAFRPMTASLAYNASKAAASMMTQQMARELGRLHDITVFGIAPAKIAGTDMSAQVDAEVARVRGWTPEFAEKYHRANVTMKEDIPADVLANFIGYLLATKNNHRWLAGCIIPYGG